MEFIFRCFISKLQHKGGDNFLRGNGEGEFCEGFSRKVSLVGCSKHKPGRNALQLY